MSRTLQNSTLVLLFLLGAKAAFAGPPFQTDDPEPVEFHHFEAYLFELSDGTVPGGTDVEVPSFEMNYGAAPNLQLHVVLPVLFNFSPDGGPVTYGVGDTELGAKYRFIQETKHMPQVGIFPFVELPTGNAARGLGVGRTWYRLPLWIQKSWGPWTTYGGAGEVVQHAPGYNNYPFAGWLTQRDLSKKLTLGVELYGHAAEGLAATSTRASTMADLGGFYRFKEGFQLLFAGGRSIAGQAETYTYLAFYWAWGKGGSKDEKSQPCGAGPPGRIASF